MDEKLKDAVRPWTIDQRVLNDLRKLQAEIELVRVHCIDLEKIVMVYGLRH